MIPIGDDNRGNRFPAYVNIALILTCILVFVFFQGFGSNDRFTYAWSTVPQEIVTGRDVVTPDQTVVDPSTGQTFVQPGLQPTPISVYLTLLMSMFMHGSLAHIAGNMLFLWIFGDNVENAMGHFRYLVFYLVCGVIASLAQVYATVTLGGNPLIPSLGASGAISGVLAGYLILFPQRRVRVILFQILTDVPAIVAIGVWFLFQLVSGLGLLGGIDQGGVAYAAHVGGFIAGLLLVRIFAAGQDANPGWNG
ncbi:MAG: rhomboid family intramembrane serine protease [Anaerolineaceae bacterium]|nr:rhomboid family intramembrane serine protease [Anaerolineaceae bacterium]